MAERDIIIQVSCLTRPASKKDVLADAEKMLKEDLCQTTENVDSYSLIEEPDFFLRGDTQLCVRLTAHIICKS